LFKSILTWAQRALFAGAIVLLGYCAFVVLDIWTFQHREAKALERLLHYQANTGPVAAGSTAARAALPIAATPITLAPVTLAPIVGPQRFD